MVKRIHLLHPDSAERNAITFTETQRVQIQRFMTDLTILFNACRPQQRAQDAANNNNNNNNNSSSSSNNNSNNNSSNNNNNNNNNIASTINFVVINPAVEDEHEDREEQNMLDDLQETKAITPEHQEQFKQCLVTLHSLLESLLLQESSFRNNTSDGNLPVFIFVLMSCIRDNGRGFKPDRLLAPMLGKILHTIRLVVLKGIQSHINSNTVSS
jgi:hypothetical protein